MSEYTPETLRRAADDFDGLLGESGQAWVREILSALRNIGSKPMRAHADAWEANTQTMRRADEATRRIEKGIERVGQNVDALVAAKQAAERELEDATDILRDMLAECRSCGGDGVHVLDGRRAPCYACEDARLFLGFTFENGDWDAAREGGET